MFYDQQEFPIRCEWGEHGVTALAPISDVIIIVDVLSFSTSVDIAVDRGATVYPFGWKDQRAAEFAASISAELADPQRKQGRYSLSPASLLQILPGTRIVLPSPNGATLSLAAGSSPVLAGCLRNARTAAEAARSYGSKIAVVAAGERWADDHTLRPCFEDLIGAGAIISHLEGSLSPEAMAAVAAFEAAKSELRSHLRNCSSGRELIGRGFPEDVDLAAQLDVSESAPTLINGAFLGRRTENPRG
jgi:2-phosphosulfolactate phosphatase